MTEKSEGLTIETIEANGLTFAYHAMGTGPLVLFLHGFPDTADTWLDSLPRFAAAGYRAVAPFMRGYAPTEIPVDKAYSSLDLGRDVLALIEAFGEERAILVAHDWGASSAYAAAAMDPAKVHKLVTLAIPHPGTIKPSIGGLWRARHFLTFQRRKATLKKLQKNHFAFVKEIYQRWSPKWDVSEAELAPIKACFAQPGVPEAVLGYYWAMPADQRNPAFKQVLRTKIPVPTLALAGDSDGALDPALYERTHRAFSGDYSYDILPGVGHFLHREDPEAYLERVLAFLGTPAPLSTPS